MPDHYYRKSMGRDYLLEKRGWLHLHVGHDIDDDVGLVVEQTADAVIFIGLTNHDIFRERPVERPLAFGSQIAKAKLRKDQLQLRKSCGMRSDDGADTAWLAVVTVEESSA